MKNISADNYLKSIYHVQEQGGDAASTKLIAQITGTSAPSVTSMLSKLERDGYISYSRYHGARLTRKGRLRALMVIRKHRLWEFFLVDKLGMKWDEVHVIAEQLEHVDSDLLIERLDAFLGFPSRDPHGDPIPDSEGRITADKLLPLSELPVGRTAMIVAVNNHKPGFLRKLSELGLLPEASVEVKSRSELDGVMAIRIDSQKKLFHLGQEVAEGILIKLN